MIQISLNHKKQYSMIQKMIKRYQILMLLITRCQNHLPLTTKKEKRQKTALQISQLRQK